MAANGSEAVTLEQLKHLVDGGDVNDGGMILTTIANNVIPKNADLNDYCTPGVYSCKSGTDAGTIANSPHPSCSYLLYVVTPYTREIANVTVLQIAIVGCATSPRIMMRRCNPQSSEYTDWETFSTSDTTYTLTKDGSTIKLTGSDGTESSVTDENTTYPLASSTQDGLMSSEQYTKLEGMEPGGDAVTYTLTKTGNEIYLNGSDGSSTHVTDEDTTYELASSSSSGLMSSSQYTKLNNLPSSFSGATFTPLYNSSSGTGSSASLSHSIANFKMIAVMCCDDKQRVCSTLCYNNGSSSATVAVSRNVYSSTDGYIYTTCGVVTLSGTKATLSMKGQGWISNNNNCDVVGDNETFFIKSVVGIDW